MIDLEVPEADVIPGRYYFVTLTVNPTVPSKFRNHCTPWYTSYTEAISDMNLLSSLVHANVERSAMVLNKNLQDDILARVTVEQPETWHARVTLWVIDRNGETLQ